MSQSPIVWTLSFRLLHWALALTVTAVYFLEGGDSPHNLLGYAAAGSILGRWVWGWKKEVHRENWLARIVYWLIWLSVIALAVTGFMYGMDRFWGEEWLSELHLSLAQALQVLIALHLLGLSVDSYRFRRKTWMGMFSGRRS